MWVKAYVEERSDGLVEILIRAHKGFYKVWVHPNDPARVEVMIDGVIKGRASTKLRELEEGIDIETRKAIRKRSSTKKSRVRK
jgi:hypothetical protein